VEIMKQNCAYKKAWTLAQQLESPSWQYFTSLGKVLSCKQFLDQKSTGGKEHPHYSPNLVLNDFLLFPKIWSTLKGPWFQDIEDIQNKSDNGTESYSTRGVPKVLPIVAVACLG
jgi:hypothetical protein